MNVTGIYICKGVILSLSAILILSVLPYRQNPPISTLQTKVVSGGIVVTTTMLLFVSMLLWWTPFASPTIEGIQGRYFLPLIPFASLLVQHENFTFRQKRNEIWYVLAAAFFSLLAVLQSYYIIAVV
jgi:uncharacterized membrane protein